jgi:hypothetical protein
MTRQGLTAIVGASLSLLGVAGCDSSDTQVACVPDTGFECGSEVRRSTIDTGEGFELDPGDGVGVFVEYDGAGRYYVSTTCDSYRSGYACYFDILLSAAEGEIFDVEPADLEDDGLDFLEDGSVSFRGITEYDVDSFIVQTEPGTVLSVDVLLDCSCGNPYLFWVGDGATHSGSPSNPLELEPSTP